MSVVKPALSDVRFFGCMIADRNGRFDLTIRTGDEVRFLKPSMVEIVATGRAEGTHHHGGKSTPASLSLGM